MRFAKFVFVFISVPLYVVGFILGLLARPLFVGGVTGWTILVDNIQSEYMEELNREAQAYDQDVTGSEGGGIGIG